MNERKGKEIRERENRETMKKGREKGKKERGSEVFKMMSSNCRDNSGEEQQERRPSTGYITD